jgi:hypothetical protein
MHLRHYNSERDGDAVHRLWMEVGWLQKGQEESMDLLIGCGRAMVAEVDGEAEALVASAPGTVCYLNTELPLCALTTASTSRRLRRRGAAKRLLSELVALDAAEGALVAGLGMFEQGFYNQLGFGTGSYEHWITFDPAWLKKERETRLARRITPQDWEAAHAARLHRHRVHGSCSLHPPEITRAEMTQAKNGFGFGYGEGSAEQLTHCFWCSTKEPEFGPYHIHWMAYRTWDQFLELMALFRTLGDQVRLVRMREPPGLQFQDLLDKPFQRRRVSEGGRFETGIRALAYWQMRICDLEGCLAHTGLKAAEVRFNLQLSDPIGPYLGQDAPWRGIGGDYVVTLGRSSGAETGRHDTLPTLKASVGAFTRLWLGVRSASSLAATDALSGPQELLQDLDEKLLCLPEPRWDWDF